MDDWGENGENHPPSPISPQLRTKRKREERERAIDHTQAADYYEKSARRRSPPRERPQPHGRDRHSAPARPRSPPVRALPAGGSRIHWGLIRPYDAHTEFGEHVARPQAKQPATTLSPTRSGSELKPAIALAHGNRTHRPHHTRARISAAIALTARSLGPRNRGHPDFSPRLQILTTARRGTPWITQPATARTKSRGHECPRQRHSTAPPVHISRARVTAGVLLRRPCEAETRQLTDPSRSRDPLCGPARCTYRDHQPWPMYVGQNAAYTGPWGPSTGPSPMWHQPAQPQPGLHWGKHHWDYTGTALRSGSPWPQPLAWEHTNGSGRRTSTGLPCTGIPHGSQPLGLRLVGGRGCPLGLSPTEPIMRRAPPSRGS